MFRDSLATRLETSKSKEEVYNSVEEQLDSLGRTTISDSGSISISDVKFSGFGYNTTIEGRIVKRNDYYNLDLDFNANPGIIAWIIAICLFPIGVAIFILPYNAKEEFTKKAKRIFDDLNYDFEENNNA